ncbi:hypothetical protein BDZ89DRAFT_1044100 [Hymenopellis radicata]|nr:hypothetical protein BDZ89DRAFT_1044100 [Hymenopellis radicata]
MDLEVALLGVRRFDTASDGLMCRADSTNLDAGSWDQEFVGLPSSTLLESRICDSNLNGDLQDYPLASSRIQPATPAVLATNQMSTWDFAGLNAGYSKADYSKADCLATIVAMFLKIINDGGLHEDRTMFNAEHPLLRPPQYTDQEFGASDDSGHIVVICDCCARDIDLNDVLSRPEEVYRNPPHQQFEKAVWGAKTSATTMLVRRGQDYWRY